MHNEPKWTYLLAPALLMRTKTSLASISVSYYSKIPIKERRESFDGAKGAVVSMAAFQCHLIKEEVELIFS